jgi:hypothetical protein
MRMSTPVVLLSLLVVAAMPLRAQSSDAAVNDSVRVVADTTQRTTESARAASPSSSTTSGASLTGLRSGVHVPQTARAATYSVAPGGALGLGQSRAMMIVGAAALVTGAVIGGDAGTLIMVGGAVIGLVGLYNYLQ